MDKKKIILYYRTEPETDKYFKGDLYIRKLYRKLFRRKKVSGIERVFLNLCKSFDLLNIKYQVNKPFSSLLESDIPIVIGRGKYALDGYDKPNKIIAGIALMTHPSEWPSLCTDYPIAKYLQHSEWANNVYKKYFGDVCDTWFSGIDVQKWHSPACEKTIDFLVYQKFHWDVDTKKEKLLLPILSLLKNKGYTFELICYGNYIEQEYFQMLSKAKYMIFLSEHESQGFACGEALSMNIPILAWDQGLCLDPNRFTWKDPEIAATSVPFFNENCGLTFRNIEKFKEQLEQFISLAEQNAYRPREYVIQNLTLKKSGERMLEIIRQVYPDFDDK